MLCRLRRLDSGVAGRRYAHVEKTQPARLFWLQTKRDDSGKFAEVGAARSRDAMHNRPIDCLVVMDCDVAKTDSFFETASQVGANDLRRHQRVERTAHRVGRLYF